MSTVNTIAAEMRQDQAVNADPADTVTDLVMLSAEQVFPDRAERRRYYDRLIDALEGVRDSNWPDEIVNRGGN